MISSVDGVRAVITVTAALMALPGVAAALGNIEYQLAISDQSPALVWNPSPPTPGSNGDQSKGLPNKAWNVTYSETSWGEWTAGASGAGTSAHLTSAPGATLMVDFVGTGVAFLGTADGAQLSLVANGGSTSISSVDGTLATVSGLDYGSHSVTLVSSSGTVSVTGVTVTTVVASEASVKR